MAQKQTNIFQTQSSSKKFLNLILMKEVKPVALRSFETENQKMTKLFIFLVHFLYCQEAEKK